MNQKLRILFLTLITMMVGVTSYAGDTYTVSFNGKDEQSQAGYFTFSDKHNFNNKFKDATYAGITFTSGLKMESATKIDFTSTATSTVTIVQSTYNANTIKFGGNELNVSDAEAGTGCRIYTITDVEPGSYTIERGGGESGLFYISVEYTGATLQVLSTPTISFDSSTGVVTITGDSNASSIVYTTDGTDPTANNGNEYESPFTVGDGVTVKAIAIGDGQTYTNSEIAAVEVLLEGVTVETPVIKVVYGTFAITCETANVTLEYSLDGQTWIAYTAPVTLSEDGTVHARATRGDSSATASADVTAVSKGDATGTIVLTYNDFDVETVDGLSTLVGKDAAEGFSISLNNPAKAWASGGLINDNRSIKLSNGAQNTLHFPEGVSATRITFYSYIISATPGRVSGWKEVGNLTTNYTDVPMAASATTDPDVRVFPLTGDETQLNFNNGGDQLCFYIVLDVKGMVMPVKPIKDVILSYTVDATSTADSDLEATPGKIYFGADKFATTTVTETGYAYKSDGDVGSTKYILLKPSRALAAGDIIEIEAFAVSTPSGEDYGFCLYDERGASTPLTTLYLTVAKNTLQTLTYTVTESDGLEGLTEIWVFRAPEKSTYFYSANIYGYVIPEEYTITLGDYGKATFYDSKVAYTIPEGLTASVVETVSSKTINLFPIESGVIPADCGVVLEGTAGETYTLVPTSETSPAYENLLRGTDVKDLTVGDDPGATYKFYALSVYNNQVCFCWMTDGGAAFNNEPHKAYLPIKQTSTTPTSGSNAYYFDNPDGLQEIQVKPVEVEALNYNLSGQRVDKSYKGVIIANGVKVINQ